jgi:hypothetical protein
LAKRIDSVAIATAVEFEGADAPGGAAPRTARLAVFTINREVQHFESLGVGGMRAAMLKGLDCGWGEPDFVELGLFLACSCKRQMGVMHGIEATAKYAKTHRKSRAEESRVKSQRLRGGWHDDSRP